MMQFCNDSVLYFKAATATNSKPKKRSMFGPICKIGKGEHLVLVKNASLFVMT